VRGVLGPRVRVLAALARGALACASLAGCSGAGEDGAVPTGGWMFDDAGRLVPVPWPDLEEPDAAARDAGAGDATVPRDAGSIRRDACADDPSARPNAGLRESVQDARCPPGMVVSGSVCIDRYEAFIDRVDDAGATVESLSPYRPPPSAARTAARSVVGAVPHGYVSGLEAERACRGAGKRLCTSDEWLRACRGAAGNVYPYGNARRAGACNDAYAAGHPAATCYGTTASWIYSAIDYAGINQQPNTVDRAGANAGCVTAEGVFDLMGNLHEWVRDTAATPPTSAVDFRGGFYADTSRNGEGCLYATSAHSFSHWDYSTGFRCCASLR
jgi:sulfatase modifying factor 1